jgi:hypothetical protein
MQALHPFAATLTQMRKPDKQGGGFANLNDQQRWEWHADAYAYNQVILSRGDSPCDPGGEWFDAPRVKIAARYYHTKFVEPREARRRARGDELQREGRALVNGWAKRHGLATIDQFAEVRSMDAVTASAMAAHELVIEKARQRPQVDGFQTLGAADLGATTHERTAAEMAAGRRELGITVPDTTESDPQIPRVVADGARGAETKTARAKAPAKSSVRKRTAKRPMKQRWMPLPINGGAADQPVEKSTERGRPASKSQRRSA